MRQRSARALPEWGQVGLLALVYFGLGLASDRLFDVPPLPWGFFWPPAGMYLAVLLRMQKGTWPLVVLAFALADVLSTSSLGLPVTVALGVAVAQAVEALMGAFLMFRVLRGPVTLGSIRQVLALVVLGAVVGPLVGGTLGAALTEAGGLGGVSFGEVWLFWWMGDMLGVLVTAPFCLAVVPPPQLERARWLEAAALCGLGLVAVQAVFVGNLPAALAVPLPYATLLLLLWAAVRLGLPGRSTVSLMMSAMAGWHAARGHGPFLTGGLPLAQRALAVQGVLAVAGLFGLLLAAALEERRRAEQRQRLLAQVSASVAEARNEAEALQRVAQLLVPAVADGCGLVHTREEGEAPIVAHVHVDPARAVLLARSLPLRLPGADRSGRDGVLLLPQVQPAQLERLGADGARRRALRELAPTSLLAVPLDDARRPEDELVLLCDVSARVLDAQDAALAAEVAHRCALAVERIRLLRQTQEAVQLRDDFLATASHELKTPLTPLLLQLQILHRRIQSGECPDAASVEKARRAVRRLVALIDDLLDATRVVSGRLVMDVAPMSLTQLVREVTSGFEGVSRLHHVEHALPDEELWVRGDHTRLEQLLVNLLDNAIKYSPAGGTVKVSLSPEGAQLHLSVSDPGIGIPPDQQRWLFERFFRARNVSVRSFGGLGLGLYICHDIVERHGGRIWVESTVGKGSTFHVSLPRLPAPRTLDVSAEASPPH